MPLGETRIAVVGLGYVGLPIACAFAAAGFPVVGYDIDAGRIAELARGHDRTGECSPERLKNSNIRYTTNPSELTQSNFIIITAPTPINQANRPDLSALLDASKTVGQNLSPGSIVVFESTVYPGVTEELCGPLIQKESGLSLGSDFKLGYCPERINPGDREHTLEKIVKVISGSDSEALKTIAQVYGTICKGGIWKASQIKVAEAAKVIENVQRDLNIALMNELSMLFERIGINTRDVLDAAGSKWNFHRYTPGLVGGHCIGVDPYYLTHLAETVGHHPQLILAGRRINDQMPRHVVDRMLLALVKAGKIVNQSKILILGVTFKENIPDTRNSKVAQVSSELANYGIDVYASDPVVPAALIRTEFQAEPVDWPLDSTQYDLILVAVKHREFQNGLNVDDLAKRLIPPGIIYDLKWMYDRKSFPPSIRYETL